MYGWGKSCAEYTKPATLLGPHAALLGMRFYTGSMFPSQYQGAIFSDADLQDIAYFLANLPTR